MTVSSSDEIGNLNEGPLHAALKDWYALPRGEIEVPYQGYLIDVIADGLLFEIQTGNFASIEKKLSDLVETRRVRLVYPVAKEKWLLKEKADGGRERRKSPKEGKPEDVFRELVSFPGLMRDPNFSLEVILIQEEELRRYDSDKRRGKGGWVKEESHLLKVVENRLFRTPEDLAQLLPEELPRSFTTADIAEEGGCRRDLAQKMAYCLREMEAIEKVGKQGNAFLYRRSVPS